MYIEFNRVTWYSKLAAVILFIFVVPWLTFYLGREYQKTIDFFKSTSEITKPVTESQKNISNQTMSWPVDVEAGAYFTYAIDPGADEMLFVLRGTDNTIGTFSTIQVLMKDKNGKYEVVQILDAQQSEPPPSKLGYFVTRDMNFDGYEDISLLTWWGATGNAGFNYWLYNPKTKEFVFNETLSSLSNPTPHTDSQTITTHSNGGAAGMIFVDQVYKYGNGEYVFIKEVKQEETDGTRGIFTRTTTELKDGKMQVVKTETIQPTN
jgi:hypothetical protein